MHETNHTKETSDGRDHLRGRVVQDHGACFEVYQPGTRLLEPVYQECLEIELADRGIPFVPSTKLPIVYKGRTFEQFYKADFVCYDKIIVEVKAVTRL